VESRQGHTTQSPKQIHQLQDGQRIAVLKDLLAEVEKQRIGTRAARPLQLRAVVLDDVETNIVVETQEKVDRVDGSSTWMFNYESSKYVPCMYD
jgi:hypothetical protein